MLKLKENEVCPKMNVCPYSTNCFGTFKDRNSTFNCDFVDDNGRIRESCSRSIFNKTGNFKILCE